jgi:hypothetical protein
MEYGFAPTDKSHCELVAVLKKNSYQIGFLISDQLILQHVHWTLPIANV